MKGLVPKRMIVNQFFLLSPSNANIRMEYQSIPFFLKISQKLFIDRYTTHLIPYHRCHPMFIKILISSPWKILKPTKTTYGKYLTLENNILNFTAQSSIFNYKINSGKIKKKTFDATSSFGYRTLDG